MTAGRVDESRATALQSPVHWAVLGLIIERPSYGYELAGRFQRAFGDALSISSPSYVYKAIGVLEERGLIEEVPGTRRGRQPRPRYLATRAGIEGYQEQLIAEAGEGRRRSWLFARKLAVFVRQPELALTVLERYRDECLAEALRSPLASQTPEAELDSAARLAARLDGEEARVQIDAKLAWLDFAADELKAHVAARAARP
jgi:DNA-binding PadR family transcriptional regulator